MAVIPVTVMQSRSTMFQLSLECHALVTTIFQTKNFQIQGIIIG